MKKSYISITFVTMLIGIMLAVQFNSTKQSDDRDTRDSWEIREDYTEAQELQTKLLQEIRTNEEKIAQYETDRHNSKEQVFLETLDELRAEAGLLETEGPGITIKLTPITQYIIPGESGPFVSSDILRKLINELNMYGATAISIAEQRVINTTVIREVAGVTKIDGYPLNTFPIEVKVIASSEDQANKLYNRMQISSIPDDFFIDNLSMEISEPKEKLMIPKYQNDIDVKKMEPVKEEGGK
ncbi:DUF881 domain-containing protein [Caldibacillus lycopersici]|uniref:DUF881 domain-containing protein n=1 Tax=Perspicuibacillus lycopersici TaxID=1325689 RepID=A0AAE3LRX9_9BACI|nr:DUF881 domain-containing protein [Perspicuibacillus lycopersici]MCU9612193.1 DUF881 domain-containing protein [Perspicuibacillus lycopersici]